MSHDCIYKTTIEMGNDTFEFKILLPENLSAKIMNLILKEVPDFQNLVKDEMQSAVNATIEQAEKFYVEPKTEEVVG